jgi:hypothetical protein
MKEVQEGTGVVKEGSLAKDPTNHDKPHHLRAVCGKLALQLQHFSLDLPLRHTKVAHLGLGGE